jgi:hypothetical protein
LPFWVTTNTVDWQAASITRATAQHMLVRGLIQDETSTMSYKRTDQGRAVLDALAAGGKQ